MAEAGILAELPGRMLHLTACLSYSTFGGALTEVPGARATLKLCGASDAAGFPPPPPSAPDCCSKRRGAASGTIACLKYEF